jgi:hypothetical protein
MTSPTTAVTPSVVETRLLRIFAALNDCELHAASRATIGDITRAAFTPSLRPSEYRANALNPGGLNLEVSFSEMTPRALRFDAAPAVSAPAAAQHVAERLTALTEDVLAPWRAALAAQRFGGFVSVVADGAAPPKRKAYLELRRDPTVLEQHVPATWAHLLDGAVPGILPHFVALGDGTPRIYLECTYGLAFTDLVELASRCGLTAEMLAAVETVRRLTGGSPLLPPGALCAVRSRPGGRYELKLELPSTILTSDCVDIVTAILMQRPRSEQAFQGWRAALGQEVVPSVVSVRLGTGLTSPLLNVYAGLTV